MSELPSLRLAHELEGHTDRVWSLAWKPNSGNGSPSVLASCSGDKTVRIWECLTNAAGSRASWTCQAILDDSHTRTVRSCAWSPDGKLLATASFDATTAIWENVGGDYECIATLEGHENEVKSVAWNAAGTLLATCSRDKMVWIWDLQPGNEFECLSVLSGHSQDVKMVLWHPTYEILVSSSYDNTIKIWMEDVDGDDWHCVQTLGDASQGHTSTVWQVSFNISGDKMVSCSDDLQLMVWDTSGDPSDTSGRWKHLYTISGYHDRTIFSVDWSRKTNLIATGGADDCIRVFAEEQKLDPSPGRSSFSLVLKNDKSHTPDVNCVRWHPEEIGVLASTGDDEMIKIWEVQGYTF